LIADRRSIDKTAVKALIERIIASPSPTVTRMQGTIDRARPVPLSFSTTRGSKPFEGTDAI
jgi:hypothetical protein